jgi:hypothetical protein
MKRAYDPPAGQKTEQAIQETKQGQPRSSGQKVSSEERAIVVGLLQTRKAGGKGPHKE